MGGDHPAPRVRRARSSSTSSLTPSVRRLLGGDRVLLLLGHDSSSVVGMFERLSDGWVAWRTIVRRVIFAATAYQPVIDWDQISAR
jgi:hypothetical protein